MPEHVGAPVFASCQYMAYIIETKSEKGMDYISELYINYNLSLLKNIVVYCGVDVG